MRPNVNHRYAMQEVNKKRKWLARGDERNAGVVQKSDAPPPESRRLKKKSKKKSVSARVRARFGVAFSFLGNAGTCQRKMLMF